MSIMFFTTASAIVIIVLSVIIIVLTYWVFHQRAIITEHRSCVRDAGVSHGKDLLVEALRGISG